MRRWWKSLLAGAAALLISSGAEPQPPTPVTRPSEGTPPICTKATWNAQTCGWRQDGVLVNLEDATSSSDCDPSGPTGTVFALCAWDAASVSLVSVGGGGGGPGGGDIEAVGVCTAGNCFQSAPANQLLGGPASGPNAPVDLRALVDADIPAAIARDAEVPSLEAQLLFKTIDTPQGTDPVADTTTDTLTLLEGEAIDVVGDATSDQIIFSAEDATASNKGVLALTNDLGGTSALPTVVAVQSNAVGDVGDLAAAMRTGLDLKVVTGTAGATNELLAWNVDGDAVARGNPANCPIAGQAAGGIDATGAAEDCFAPVGTGDITAVGDCPNGDCFQVATANQVFAGPTSGGAAIATMRALVWADIPSAPKLQSSSGATDCVAYDTVAAQWFHDSGAEGGTPCNNTHEAGEPYVSGDAIKAVDNFCVGACTEVAVQAAVDAAAAAGGGLVAMPSTPVAFTAATGTVTIPAGVRVVGHGAHCNTDSLPCTPVGSFVTRAGAPVTATPVFAISGNNAGVSRVGISFSVNDAENVGILLDPAGTGINNWSADGLVVVNNVAGLTRTSACGAGGPCGIGVQANFALKGSLRDSEIAWFDANFLLKGVSAAAQGNANLLSGVKLRAGRRGARVDGCTNLTIHGSTLEANHIGLELASNYGGGAFPCVVTATNSYFENLSDGILLSHAGVAIRSIGNHFGCVTQDTCDAIHFANVNYEAQSVSMGDDFAPWLVNRINNESATDCPAVIQPLATTGTAVVGCETTTIEGTLVAGDLSCTSASCIQGSEIQDASVGEVDLATADFGSFSCGAGAQDCLLDANSVGANELSSTAILLGDIDAGDLPSDGYAATYVNVTGDTLTGDLLIDNAKELRLGEVDTAGVQYLGFNTAPRASSLTLTWNINTATCTGDANGGTLTINNLNEIVCTADDGGGGGAGDSIEVEDGDNLGTFTPIDTLVRFEDQGDIDFVRTGGYPPADVITALIRPNSVELTTDTVGNYAAGDAEAGNATGVSCTDCVALTTETSGNYVASVATGLGLTGGAAGSEGAILTLAFATSATLATDPALNAEECVFSKDGSGGVLLCEGETADAIEGLLVWSPTTADRTLRLPDATDTLVARDTTDTLTNKTITAAANTVTIDGEDITGGTVADTRIASTLTRDSESPAAGDISGSHSAGYQIVANAVGAAESSLWGKTATQIHPDSATDDLIVGGTTDAAGTVALLNDGTARADSFVTRSGSAGSLTLNEASPGPGTWKLTVGNLPDVATTCTVNSNGDIEAGCIEQHAGTNIAADLEEEGVTCTGCIDSAKIADGTIATADVDTINRSEITGFTLARVPYALIGGTLTDEVEFTWDETNNRLSVGSDTTAGVVRFDNNINDGDLTRAALTASRTWTLPDETGTVCTSGSVCSGYEADAHAGEHQHGGGDEVATATPAANAIPKAGAGGTLADGWISGGIARSNATYLVQSADATLTAEQVVVGGAGIGVTFAGGDGGNATWATASTEAGFLTDGGTTNLGTSLIGACQAMDDGRVQCRDGSDLLKSFGGGTFNVRDYGATGDGVTDDKVGFQAAIDAASSASGTVVCPPGTYMMGSGALALKSNAAIVGPRSCIIKRITSATGFLVQAGATVNNFAVVGITIDGNSTGASRPVDLAGSNYGFVFDSVEIKGSPTNTDCIFQTTGTDETNKTRSFYRNNYIHTCARYGLWLRNTTSVSIVNNRIRNASRGINLDGTTTKACRDIVVSENQLLDIDTHGIGDAWVAGHPSAYDPGCTGLVYANNIVTRAGIAGGAATNAGIVSQGTNVVISGNVIRDNGDGDGDNSIITQGENIAIIGNLVEDGTSVGIDIGLCNHCSVVGNVIVNNDAWGIEVNGGDYLVIADNTLRNNNDVDGAFVQAGIGITASNDYGSVDRITITGNRIHGGAFQEYGILIDPDSWHATANTVTNVFIADNDANGGGSVNDILVRNGATYVDGGGNRTDDSLSIASGSSVTIPDVGDLFTLTGTTTVNTLNSAGGEFYDGRRVTLRFASTVSLGDLVGNIDTYGPFRSAANGSISLIRDGSNWREVSRSLANATKSVFWPAGSLNVDGTQCGTPAARTINSGPRTHTIACIKNAAATLYGQATMPDSWNTAAGVTFELIVEPEDAGGNYSFDFSAMCDRHDDPIAGGAAWGAAVANTISLGATNFDLLQGTTAAVTPGGTCAAGAQLWWRAVMNTTATTATAAQTVATYILGVKMEYNALSLSDE